MSAAAVVPKVLRLVRRLYPALGGRGGNIPGSNTTARSEEGILLFRTDRGKYRPHTAVVSGIIAERLPGHDWLPAADVARWGTGRP